MNMDMLQLGASIQIFSSTAIAVGIMFGAAGLGSAIGWGLITSKTLEATARQPELKSKLWLDMFVFAGLMEAFPFIILGLAFWLIFANPFPGLLHIGK